MKKFLRYYLVVLMAMFCGTVIAQEVTLDFTTNDSWNLPVNSANKATASASFSNGSYSITLAAADGYYFNTDGYLMLGKSGSTLTFPAFSFDVEKIVITGRDAASASTKQNIYVGDVAVSTETTGAKTANTYEIAADYQAAGNIYVLKVTSAHNTQITKIEIYKKGGGSTVTVTAPTISGTTPFTGSTDVTISGTPEGGKTYYTTDGSDPTSSSTLYSAPFTISETTTVKAISYDKDGNASSVTSKTFTKEEIATANTIAELLEIESGKTANLKLNNAVVLFAGTNDIIIKDATAGVDFYQTGLSLTAGQVLNGTITVLRSDYNQFKEVKKTDGTSLDNVTVSEGTITPTKTTVATVANANDCSDLFKLENVEVVANGSNYDIVDGDNTIRLYDQFKLNFTKTAGKFNIIGVVGSFKGTKQFWPTEAPEAAGEVTIGAASDIDDFKSQDQGKLINLNLANAQVVYAWTSSNGNIQAFVRDDTGAICMDFRNNNEPGKSFTTDKIVNGSIIMNNTVYNGLPQASATAETNTEKLTFSDGSAAEPVKISSADVSRKINDLVLLENVTITEKDGKYYVDDVQLFNQFKLEAFNDFSTFVGEGKNVKGIAVIYQPKTGDPIYEIYPIEITSVGGGETPVETSKAIYYWIDTFEAANEVTFEDGAKIAITGNSEKTISKGNKITVDGSEYTSMKLSNGAQNTLTMPAGCKVVKMTFYSYINKPSTEEPRSNYWKEVAGVQYDETNALSCYNDGDLTKPDVREFTLTEPSNSVTFTNTGYQLCYVLVVEYTKSGTDGIQNIVKPAIENGIRYNLAGQRVDENYKGVVIMNGKKYVVK